MKKNIFLIILFSLFILPALSFAQMPSIPSNSIELPTQTTQNTPPVITPRSGAVQSSTISSSLFCYLNANTKLGDLIEYVTCIINKSVIPLIFTLATAMFLWGVVQYVIGSQEEAKREKGREFMIWGIIALAVMFSVWGLVAVLGNTFNISNVLPSVK